MLEIYAHAEAVGQRDLRSTVDLLYRDIIPNRAPWQKETYRELPRASPVLPIVGGIPRGGDTIFDPGLHGSGRATARDADCGWWDWAVVGSVDFLDIKGTELGIGKSLARRVG